MLNILAMLSNQGRRKFQELLPQLGNELRADQVLDGLLFLGLRVDVDVKLEELVDLVSYVTDGSTYYEVILLGVMGDLGYGYSARHVIFTRGGSRVL